MAFNFSSLLEIVKAVSKTGLFQSAGELMFQKVGEEITAKANHPEEIKKIGAELIKGAPELIGAIAKGTKAEPLVAQDVIHRTGEETKK